MNKLLQDIEARQQHEEKHSTKGNIKGRKSLALAVQFLSQNRGIQTLEEIRSYANVPIEHEPELVRDLQGVTSIIKEGLGYRYVAVHDGINDIEDLKMFLRANPNGIFRSELEDAYVGVNRDLEAMLDNKFMFELYNKKKKKTLLVPYQHNLELELDNKILEFWNSVRMPVSLSILEQKLVEKQYVVQDDIMLTTAAEIKTSKVKKARKSRKRSMTNLTNVHLLEKKDYAWLSQG